MTARELAEQLELDLDRFECCMSSEQAERHIQQDILAGIELKLLGTPAFVVNGEIAYGALPKGVVSRVLGSQGSAAP